MSLETWFLFSQIYRYFLSFTRFLAPHPTLSALAYIRPSAQTCIVPDFPFHAPADVLLPHSPCPQLHSRPDQRFGTPSPLNFIRPDKFVARVDHELQCMLDKASRSPLCKGNPLCLLSAPLQYIKVCPQISLDRSLDGVVIRVLFSIPREKEREKGGSAVTAGKGDHPFATRQLPKNMAERFFSRSFAVPQKFKTQPNQQLRVPQTTTDRATSTIGSQAVCRDKRRCRC
jgi:hypothetical protein